MIIELLVGLLGGLVAIFFILGGKKIVEIVNEIDEKHKTFVESIKKISSIFDYISISIFLFLIFIIVLGILAQIFH